MQERDQEVIRGGIQDSLEALKAEKQDEDDSGDLTQLAFSRFTYDIANIQVDGNNATAALNVEVLDLYGALVRAEQELSADGGDEELNSLYAIGSDEDLSLLPKKVRESILQHADDEDLVCQGELILVFQKENDAWRMDDESLQTLAEALYGRL